MDSFSNLIRNILNKIFEFFGVKLTDNTYSACVQFIKFGIVGLSNTLLSYLLYVSVLKFLIRFDILHQYHYLLAQLLAFVLSVLWSFYWNNKTVFKLEEDKTRSVWKSLIKTYISYSLTGLWLNSVLLLLWIEICGISEYIAPVINLIFSIPLNFLINKYWAFKQK